MSQSHQLRQAHGDGPRQHALVDAYQTSLTRVIENTASPTKHIVNYQGSQTIISLQKPRFGTNCKETIVVDTMDQLAESHYDSYSTTFPMLSSRRRSSVVPGQTLHSAIHPISYTTLEDSLISFLSYVKTLGIPILPVNKPDIRTVLGQGASFLVNGAELPEDYVDSVTQTPYPEGLIVALKRSVINGGMKDPIANRIVVIFNELLTMLHPPLRAHPNIVSVHGVSFEVEGSGENEYAMPVLVVEVAELGNLAEVLETSRKEDRPLDFGQKMALCIDVAHGLEILHACDIVHGDVKLENILTFEEEDESQKQHNAYDLRCKLTDFGVSRISAEQVVIGGSRPWQAPECYQESYFAIEAAKRTDVYSFGMLVWRVALDGDPFQHLGEFDGQTPKEKRLKRNDAVAALKREDELVSHVCSSLNQSGKFSRRELEVLNEIIRMTMAKEPKDRELDFGRIIRMLRPDHWYEARHPEAPRRLPHAINVQLLDLEKWYSDLKMVSPIIQSKIVEGYRNYAEGTASRYPDEERECAAALELGIAHANAFGVEFNADRCLRWFRMAAEKGSQRAMEALPKLAKAFQTELPSMVNLSIAHEQEGSSLSQSWESNFSWPLKDPGTVDPAAITDVNELAQQLAKTWTLLSAAEKCRYDVLEAMLSSPVTAKPTTSEDGVTPLHFFSSWHLDKCEYIGRKLIQIGADLNAAAKKANSIGGTPLMWAVHGNHLQHVETLLKLGADPMSTRADGTDALSLAAGLHLNDHLQLLLESIRPSQLRGHAPRLMEAAMSGESRYLRMLRHEDKWKAAPKPVVSTLQRWNRIFPEAPSTGELLVSAIHNACTKSVYGRMNSDISISFIEGHALDKTKLIPLLRESVLNFHTRMFDFLLGYGVPGMSTDHEGKNLLHLCGSIPDHIVSSTSFAPRLLSLRVNLEGRDNKGLTPWMFAVLERKWNLAALYLTAGADPMAVDNDGYNVMGLCIRTVNVGSIKYLFKYSGAKDIFSQQSFIVNKSKNISALQLAATLELPRAHGMKTEVMGAFLITLANYGKDRDQIDFKSEGLTPGKASSALEIAASRGIVHAVKNLVKKGAHILAGNVAIAAAKRSISRLEQIPGSDQATDDVTALKKKSLERCVVILERWDTDPERTRALADDWTNMRTIDESHVKSSWEIVVFDYDFYAAMSRRDTG